MQRHKTMQQTKSSNNTGHKWFEGTLLLFAEWKFSHERGSRVTWRKTNGKKNVRKGIHIVAINSSSWSLRGEWYSLTWIISPISNSNLLNRTLISAQILIWVGPTRILYTKWTGLIFWLSLFSLFGPTFCFVFFCFSFIFGPWGTFRSSRSLLLLSFLFFSLQYGANTHFSYSLLYSHVATNNPRSPNFPICSFSRSLTVKPPKISEASTPKKNIIRTSKS